jgi:Fur family ferric uptake transcriptional regulator
MDRDLFSKIESLCTEKGLKLTGQRRVVAQVLSTSNDHPDAELVYQRACALDSKISIPTVYRTLRLFEETGIIEKHDFGDGRARYEAMPKLHHDHLIDLHTGAVVEFHNDEIEQLQEAIARSLGYKIVGHRLALFAVPIESTERN